MSLRMLLPLVLLAACTGSYNQGSDPEDNDDDTADDTGIGGADGGDGSDGDDGDDGDDGGDDGDTSPETCSHAWHPVHLSGWTKTFTATYNGKTGTATEEGLGVDSSAGENIYIYRDTMATTGTTGAGDGYSVEVSVGCDFDGEGMFVLSWAGDYNMTIADIIPMGGAVSSDLNPHRKYLPPEYAIGSAGTWDYSYTSSMQMQIDTGAPTPSNVTYNGAYSEVGFEEYTLPTGETVQAYRLINSYTSASDVPGAPIPTDGYIEQWWVKGLGLVKENSYDRSSGSDVLAMSKVLSAYTGLTPE